MRRLMIEASAKLADMLRLKQEDPAQYEGFSCGMVRPFIPDLIGLGVDVLDPIQPTGPEMQSQELKRDFGDRLTFHGGIDMQDLLPNATPAQVEAEARRYCEVAGAGGGHILAPAHVFQPDVPPENILAVYRGTA